ncbi:MAG TPA: type II and III secretion system protein [Ohtaekwangia sp.]|nr:type II and III secretion system protein [Ohtaekwangia sp.]
MLVALLTCFVQGLKAQLQFEQRLLIIGQQLSFLADSIAPGLNETANLSVTNLSIQSFLRTVAEGHDLNIQIQPSLDITLSNNFTNVKVKDLFYFLCREYQLDIRFINSIMSFYKFEPPPEPIIIPPPKRLNISFDEATNKVTFDLVEDSLRSFVKQITSLTSKNVIFTGASDLEHKLLRGYIKDMPLENALEKLAFMNGMLFSKTKDGVFIFESALPTSQNSSGLKNPGAPLAARANQGDIIIKDSLITLDVINYPIMEIINQVSPKLNISYVVFSDITGTITAKVNQIRYDELLALLFQGTNYTYKKNGFLYSMGIRTIEGFKTTALVKLNFRPIDGVEKEMPSELIKDVEIKIFRELNAFILTGNRHKIDELTSFIRIIDQPIPNVLIEVIVADTKKGFSIETGLRAFLADSVPKTSGEVFPGVDLALSSKTINNALNRLNSTGIVNLGKVTPNFYMTLKALEKNNNIQLKSTPKLSTINGSKANLVIGRSVYYVEQTQNITGGVNPITTTAQRFNKVEANLAITISPIVSGNEHITLDIVAEFSDFIPPTIQNAPPGNETRKFESKIRVRNEEMIILGGLEELSKSETGAGTPLLSRIPILKWIFSSKTRETRDNRLIVFIKPTLVY